MFGVFLGTLLVATIVGSYMAIVNRMLRSDEHWSESNQVKLLADTAAPPPFHHPVSPHAHA